MVELFDFFGNAAHIEKSWGILFHEAAVSQFELIELVRQTGLVGVHQIGKKSKDEILTYLGMENTYAIIESNGDYKIDWYVWTYLQCAHFSDGSGISSPL